MGIAQARLHLQPIRRGPLPGYLLIADRDNNRAILVSPAKRIVWQADGLRGPDDTFFTPGYRSVITNEEFNDTLTEVSLRTKAHIWRYGHDAVPGSSQGYLDSPDDAYRLANGDTTLADIKNCRIVVVHPPAHRPARIIGQAASGCWHRPPQHFGSPNGAFPMTNGGYVVTEINGDWASGISLDGHVQWSAHPPGVLYPSDTVEVSPGRYLTADYSNPGQVVEFTPGGRRLWRFGGLNQPSLAMPMANGNILVNDDFNHRIIVINPATHRIVWQYGHTGVAGRAPGYLNDPDGLDLVPPDSYLIRNAATMGQP